jgi:hypothetical protein
MTGTSDGIPILVLLNSFEMGGSQKNAIEFADAIRNHGYSPTIMGWDLRDDMNASMLEIASRKGLPVVVRDRPRRTLLAGDIVAQVAAQQGSQLVHSYSWTMFAAFWGAARWGRIPLVSTIYEMLVYSGPPYRSSFIFGTQYQLALADRKGCTYLISPPVDTQYDDPALFPPPRNDGVVRLAIISRLAEEMKARGVEIAIRTLERLPGNVQLIVTGDGEAGPRLRHLAESVNKRLGREATRFSGNAVDARPFYAEADIVLGMGGSAARALAFEKSVVAIGEHGWSETFTPESASRLSASSYWSNESVVDPETRLEQQLFPLIESESYRRQLGSFGREFIMRNQNLEMMTSKLAHVYSVALNKHVRRDWYVDAFSILVSKRGTIYGKLVDHVIAALSPGVPSR